MPMPPSWAMAIARRASVTVSMAAETKGRFREILREKRVARVVSLGRTWEYAGTNNTSSKVSALPRRRMSKLQKKDCTRLKAHLPAIAPPTVPWARRPRPARLGKGLKRRYTAGHETDPPPDLPGRL